jgi:carbamoyl-phosphate synthase large subunit
VLAKYGVRVLGTPIETVRDTEDRLRFKRRLDEIGVKTARSEACESPDEVRAAVRSIGLPVILRGAYSLGGKGSRICNTEAEVEEALLRAFAGAPRRCWWRSRSGAGKSSSTRSSATAATTPSSSATWRTSTPSASTPGSRSWWPRRRRSTTRVPGLRTIAIKTIRHLGVVGECNIQYALDPSASDYRVIEVNARLSRSSALASKATGYPLAYVAAKIALGLLPPDLPNSITRRTSAFFEPALDYIVCKFPAGTCRSFAPSTPASAAR